MMTVNTLAASLFLWSTIFFPGDIQLTMLDGATHTGALQQIGVQSVSLQTEAGQQEYPLSEVLTLSQQGPVAEENRAQGRVQLRDGSQVAVDRILRSGSTTGGLAASGQLTVPNQQVLAARLQPDTPQYREQWQTFCSRTTEKDLLVVMKRDQSGLDFLPGVVGSITAEQLSFLLDGDTVDVPLNRVYGVVFGVAADTGQTVRRSPIRIDTAAGDLLYGQTIRLQDGIWTLTTGWGEIQGRLEQIRRIDFSAGRFVMLSEHTPLQEQFFAAAPEGSVTSIIRGAEELAFPEEEQLFRPRRNQNLAGEPLRMRQREFRSGLCLHSRTEISWPLDGRFESLDAVIGIDDEVAFAMNGRNAVRLVIQTDEKVVLDQMIAGQDEPQPIHIPLTGANTLTVLVDYGDGNSLCDWLNLADARLKMTQETAAAAE